jgi:hypothetical protein
VPDVSRRTAVSLGLGTLGLTAVALAADPQRVTTAVGAAAAAFTPLAIPARSIFAGSVGRVFTAASTRGSFPVMLAAIADLAPIDVADDEDRFNLLFETSDPKFASGIYRISRTDVPMTELFVSPINTVGASGTGAQTHQALVNRRA